MTTVAILGGGAGGRSAAVELLAAGHTVRLWNRRAETIAPLLKTRILPYRGVLGEGAVELDVVTLDLADAVRGADALVVCLPSLTHAQLFEELARLGPLPPIVLNPGHTGGALQAREVWRRAGSRIPPLVELSTLTYVARVGKDGVVDTTGRAGTVRAAPLPGGESAFEVARDLFPGTAAVDNVLASSLSNVNMVLHPPGAVLGLAWAEGTGGDFRFYVDGMTPGVGRVLTRLDDERLAVAAACHLALPSLLEEMSAIGTVEGVTGANNVVGAISSGEANRTIRGPDSTEHRYYREDFPFGLLPFVALAGVAGVEVPVAEALLRIAAAAIGPGLLEHGRDARALGIEQMTLNQLLASVQTR